MISRWLIGSLILLALRLVNGGPVDKKEVIPENSNVFLESKINEYKEEVHSRQRRLLEPPKPVVVKDTNTTEGAVNGSTTTPATVSEAKDMEETSVKPKDNADNDNDDATVKPVDKSPVSTPENSTTVPDARVNSTKPEGVNNKTAETTTTTTSSVTLISTTTAAPETNATANCPGVDATLGITESDARCPPVSLSSTPTESIDDADPTVKEMLLSTYNTSGVENTTMIVKVVPSINLSSSTSESPREMMESREELVEKSQEIKTEIKIEKAGLPGGVVALLIAISFAALAVFAYVGLTLRKRYLEYRYGNRELLVNDFDTNDTNNFEL
ncbi:poly(A) polymerase [Fopius arisanus]|uniref:Poly(A) polymerase n=1 Tax=Fopius arisanus TaxID=64838 RepID=A0A0C9RQG3_9HYME|nr:PREDICTED: poly(A) polymerase-like [Fopius arisanus]